ncbi:MAG: alpha-glucosidase/alpha-galactosidase, partial [Treponema sp.]|nr:alpha-glucosidase/alpha-galactosidase [Treponema sp.]
MAVDVHAPEKYGIYQSVGDTAGVGGIIRAMRTIPQFRDIAAAVRKYAPGAWVVNYTNPMSVCTRTLYREFPGIKAFGCCHEVFHTQELLAAVLEEAGLAPAHSIQRDEIHVRVTGINHFTWIDKASWKGVDIFPYYREFARKYADTGFRRAQSVETAAADDPHEMERLKLFGCTERVKLDLFRRYGLIAAAGDRHLAEFCPHSWYLSSPEEVEKWGFALTPVSWRVTDREKLKQRAKAYIDGMPLVPVQSGEEGIKIIKALMGMGNIVTNVNLPNRGQILNLPAGAVVETNAHFSRDNIQPLVTGELPADILALITPHLSAYEGIIEAVFDNDMEKAFRVFSHDLSVQTLPLSDARALFDEMCAQTLKK